jgi:hypothetical protein
LKSSTSSLTKYYSTRSTDDLLYLLATKELTVEAKECLEVELAQRGLSDIPARVREAREEDGQFLEYERHRRNRIPTAADLLNSLVIWFGIGLCLMAIFDFFLDRSIRYGVLLAGLAVVGAGLLLVWWRHHAQRDPTWVKAS